MGTEGVDRSIDVAGGVRPSGAVAAARGIARRMGAEGFEVRGVKEIDMTINIGKMISRQFQYVEMELLQMAKSCQESGALLKVDLASKYLTEDLKIIATKICKRIESSFLCVDYNLRDLALVFPLLKDRVQLKTSSGIESLAEALEVREAGCTRFGTTATASILEDWKTHLDQQAAGAAAEG